MNRISLIYLLMLSISCNGLKHKNSQTYNHIKTSSAIFSTQDWKSKTLKELERLMKDSLIADYQKKEFPYVINEINQKPENYLESILAGLKFNNTFLNENKEFYLMTFFYSGEVFGEIIDIVESGTDCRHYIYKNEPGEAKFSRRRKYCEEERNVYNKLIDASGKYTYFGRPSDSFTTFWYYDSVADTSSFRIFFEPYFIMHGDEDPIENYMMKK